MAKAKPNRTRRRKPKTDEQHSQQVERHLAKKGPQSGDPTAPTPERMEAAKRADEYVIPILERTYTGLPTGRVTWRVEPTILRLQRYKVLDEAEMAGIEEFWKWCDAYATKGDPNTMNYSGIRAQKSGRSLTGQELAHEAQTVLVMAARSVYWMFRPMTVFIAGQAPEDMSLEAFMANKYPHTAKMGQRARREEGQRFIKFAAVNLAVFFGKSEHSMKHLWERQRRVAEEIYHGPMRELTENPKKVA